MSCWDALNPFIDGGINVEVTDPNLFDNALEIEEGDEPCPISSDDKSVENLGEMFAVLSSTWDVWGSTGSKEEVDMLEDIFAEDIEDETRLVRGRHPLDVVPNPLLGTLEEEQEGECTEITYQNDEIVIIESCREQKSRYPLSDAVAPSPSGKLNDTHSTDVDSTTYDDPCTTNASLHRSWDSSSTLSSTDSLGKPRADAADDDCSQTHDGSTLCASRLAEVIYESQRVEI